MEKKFKVLVIEDRPDDMDCVKRSLPDNCEVIPTDADFTRVCGNGFHGETILDNHERTTLKDELKKLLEMYHEELVAIVCDLCLDNEKKNKSGGIEVIRWIRDSKWNGLNLPEEFLKYIPIIVFSSTTDAGKKNQTDALLAGATSLVVKKRQLISAKNGVDENLRCTLKSQIEYFRHVCKQNNNWKDFYIALSFTGKNKNERHREFVEIIANRLSLKFQEERVFFDMNKLNDGITPSCSQNDFSELYERKCKYIIVFLSSDYNTGDNPWTKAEWIGIQKYYNNAKKNVLFVNLEEALTKDVFKNNLGIDEVIWIPAFEERENFYKSLDGEDAELDDVFENVKKNKTTIMAYNKKCIDLYHKKCNDMAKGVVSIIEKYINKEDTGKKG